MYSAEQIRNKAYIPDSTESNFIDVDIERLIIIADSVGKKLIRIRQDSTYKGMDCMFEYAGYKVESVEFLGTKFWQISW